MPAQTEDGQICAKRGDEPNASWTSELRLIISCPGSAPEVRKSESGSGSGNFAQVQVRLGGRACACRRGRSAAWKPGWPGFTWPQGCGTETQIPSFLDAAKEAPSTAPHLTHRQPGCT